MFMKLAKKLNAIIFSTTLFSASCLFAEGNLSPANETDKAMIPYKAKLEAFQAEFDTLKSVSAEDNLSPSKEADEALASYKAKLEAFQAELDALKSTSLAAQQVEIVTPSKAEEKNDLDAISLVAKLADSAILSYKAELESVKAELNDIKSQVASSMNALHEAEIAANNATTSKIEEKTLDNEALNLATKLADSAILSYKAELEIVKAELDAIKSQAAIAHQEAAPIVQNKAAYLNSLKEELGMMKNEIAASSKKALALEAQLLAKSTVPVVSPDDKTDLYLPEREKIERNNIGQLLWQSKSEDQVLLKETKQYNYHTFKAELSPFALHEWMSFTPEQKRKTMEYADRTQFSPDMAVFSMDLNY
jgi:hypothetical protein